MSHQIVRGLSINKNDQVNMNSACNNVYPKTFTTEKFECSKVDIFRYLCGGIWQPIISANGYLWAYCLAVLRKQNSTFDIQSFYSIDTESTLFKTSYELFWDVYKRVRSDKNVYIIEYEPNCYITGSNSKKYFIGGYNNAKKYNFAEAMYISMINKKAKVILHYSTQLSTIVNEPL